MDDAQSRVCARNSRVRLANNLLRRTPHLLTPLTACLTKLTLAVRHLITLSSTPTHNLIKEGWPPTKTAIAKWFPRPPTPMLTRHKLKQTSCPHQTLNTAPQCPAQQEAPTPTANVPSTPSATVPTMPRNWRPCMPTASRDKISQPRPTNEVDTRGAERRMHPVTHG